jgi:Domain of unknown function (DUF5659)
MGKNQSTMPLHDIYASAYADYKGIPIDFDKRNRRVIFLLPDTSTVSQILADFNKNPILPLLDYLTHLRKLRAQMISLRD